MSTTTYHTVPIPGDITIAYAEAGNPSNPTVLLLHGFPSSYNQYRNLIPLLADKYHVLAPDLPSFGQTVIPTGHQPTFASIATAIGHFLDALKITSFAVYIFDYGAPTAFRLALQRPKAIKAIVTQNGNAYTDGLGDAWAPIQALWATQEGTPEWTAAAEPVKSVATLETTKWQYVTGTPSDRLNRIDPNTYTLDYHTSLAGDAKTALQIKLFHDYRKNVELYPQFQQWLRESGVPVLAVWGKNDAFFIPAGAEAYKRDVKDVTVEFLDAGHFALETHLEEIVALMRKFLARVHF